MDKISWLVGIIEGGGCFSIARGGNAKKYFNVTVSVINTDMLIISECKKIIDGITGGNCKIRNHSQREHYKKCYKLVVEGFIILQKLLQVVNPYIVGNKKPEADLLLNFINRRIVINGNRQRKPDYTIDDEKYLLAYRALKNESVETIRSLSQVDNDIVRTDAINKTSELFGNRIAPLL